MIAKSSDLTIVKQRIIDIKLKIEIWDNDNKFITTLEGDVTSGGFNFSADSAVRSTSTLGLIPDEKSRTIINENGYIWINKRVHLYIGIKDQKTGEYVWWKQGVYLFTSTSVSYDATNNEMSISCSDLMAELDGSYNGQLGYLTYEFPADEELLLTSWIDEAKASGITFSTGSELFTWMVNNGHKNVLTQSTDVSVQNAAYTLMTDSTINEENADSYVNILRAGVYNEDGTLRDTIEFHSDDVTVSSTQTSLVRTITSPNRIRNIIVDVLEKLAGITDYQIDDIGEYYAIPENNPDGWEEYRKEHPTWADLPIDQTFSAGSNVLDVLNSFKDLYTFFEAYFNRDGVYCMNRIPTLYEDDVYFDDKFIQNILVSENTSIDMTTVKNVIRVWGKVLECDFYKDEGITLDNGVYKCQIDTIAEEGKKAEYKNGDMIALKLPANSPSGCSIEISAKVGNTVQSLGPLKVYNIKSGKDVQIDQDELQKDKVYVFKVYKKRQNNKTELKCYIQGQFQPQAIIALVSNATGEENVTTVKNTVRKKWSKEYFQDQYDCETVELMVIPDSPFTCQALNEELLSVCTGGEYENIDSDQLAIERARYELYKSARLPDSISLVTKIVPFADVNTKVSYRRSDKMFKDEYITNSISHDISGGTTSWNLVHFYPLYDIENTGRTTYSELLPFKYSDFVGKNITYRQIEYK